METMAENVNNNHSPSRRSYTIAFKLMVIEDYYRKYKQNSDETARQFKINGSLVRRWLKNQNLLNAYRGEAQAKRKIRPDGKGLFPELEEKLFNWIINMRVVHKTSINYEDMRRHTNSLIKKSDEPSYYE